MTLEPRMLRSHLSGRTTIEADGTSEFCDRVYDRCRSLIPDELGVSPSPEARAVHCERLQTLQSVPFDPQEPK